MAQRITATSVMRADSAWPENRPTAIVSPSMAGPNAPSAAPPPSVRSMWSADQLSTVASAMKAMSTIPPQTATRPRGRRRLAASSADCGATVMNWNGAVAATSRAVTAKIASGGQCASRIAPVMSAEAA